MRSLLFLSLILFLPQSGAQVAVVVHDRAVLRGAPRPAAQVHATLVQGEAVEVRGARLDYLQVYDYGRERGGFMRASQLVQLDAMASHELLAAMRLARALPGSELLGIAFASAYLERPAEQELDSAVEALDAIGTLAERLAKRGAPAAMEAAARYGVRFANVERDGRVAACYDGEAFRRVLALPSTPPQRARAALALTRRDCSDATLTPTGRAALEAWRAEVLEKVELKALAPYVRNRIHMRRAGVWAALAFYRARGWAAKGELAAPAAQRAIAELESVDRRELLGEDRRALADATSRVAASRPAAASVVAAPAKALRLDISHGKPGETCVTLAEAKPPAARRCTYGVVWSGSSAVSASGNELRVAVQHTETYRESWTFRKGPRGWTVRVVPGAPPA